MRQRATRLAALVPVLLLVLALSAMLSACGNATQTPNPTNGASAATPSGTPSGAPGSAAGERTVRAYFGLGSTSGQPVLAPVERAVPNLGPAGSDKEQAVQVLIDGPRDSELAGTPAMFTAIPGATKLLGVTDAGGGAWTVDLSSDFDAADELPALRTSLAQLVFTLTQFADVTGVNVTIEGEALQQTNAEGRDLTGPATRADYEDQMGPILVDDPTWGATLRSPLRLAGLADVFEAQFRFRLLDDAGRSLADGQLKASCGSGCVGTYGVDVPFTITTQTGARLQVFDPSEVDGSMQDLVDYPLTLLP